MPKITIGMTREAAEKFREKSGFDFGEVTADAKAPSTYLKSLLEIYGSEFRIQRVERGNVYIVGLRPNYSNGNGSNGNEELTTIGFRQVRAIIPEDLELLDSNLFESAGRDERSHKTDRQRYPTLV